jgi:molybdate transport system regulatory protein
MKAPPSDHTLSIRIDLAGGVRIGPGKVALLEAIAREGSISAAGRALRMSYRRAWELVENLNTGLGAPVVTTSAGGSKGGGTSLTPVGIAVVEHYRAIEAEAAAAAQRHVAAIGRFAVVPTPPDQPG